MFISVLFLSFSGFVIAKDLPSAIRHLKCAQGDSDCFLENGNKAIPIIAKGDPEYGIPNMMPLRIPFMSLISTPNLQLNLTNIEVYGLDKMHLVSRNYDDKKKLYALLLRGQNITIVGDYEADGKILVMPLKGKGRFGFYFKNGVYKSTTYIKIIEKDGDQYFKPIDSRLETKFEKIEFNFENLFDGDKRLGDQVNNFLNENWQPLFNDFGPSAEKIVANLINEILDNLTSRVPIKMLYY